MSKQLEALKKRVKKLEEKLKDEKVKNWKLRQSLKYEEKLTKAWFKDYQKAVLDLSRIHANVAKVLGHAPIVDEIYKYTKMTRVRSHSPINHSVKYKNTWYYVKYE